MTNNNITTLENHIYSSIPRLKDLSSEIKFERINKYGKHQFNRGCLGLYLVSFEQWIDQSDKTQHPITLANVFEWLKKIRNPNMYPIDYNGWIIYNSESIGQWDLTKLYLKDQSQELIDALCNLIPK